MSQFHVGVAWYTSSTVGFAFAMEVVRVFEEITRLQDRYHAFAKGEIDTYDQRWTSGCLYIPGTDVRGLSLCDKARGPLELILLRSGVQVPLHPAAVAFTPGWRLFTCIILFLCFVCEIPEWRAPTFYVGWSCIIFDRDTSVWYVGLIQAYIGMVGTVQLHEICYDTSSSVMLQCTRACWEPLSSFLTDQSISPKIL